VGAPATLDSFDPTVWKEKKKDDGCIPGQTGTLRREEREWLETSHRGKNQDIRSKTKRNPWKKKRRYACRLFGMNSFKEGAM
jgi:hypothetical protein